MFQLPYRSSYHIDNHFDNRKSVFVYQSRYTSWNFLYQHLHSFCKSIRIHWKTQNLDFPWGSKVYYRLETYPKSLDSKPDPPRKGCFLGGVCAPKYFLCFWRYDYDSKNRNNLKGVSDTSIIKILEISQYFFPKMDLKFEILEKSSIFKIFHDLVIWIFLLFFRDDTDL